MAHQVHGFLRICRKRSCKIYITVLSDPNAWQSQASLIEELPIEHEHNLAEVLRIKLMQRIRGKQRLFEELIGRHEATDAWNLAWLIQHDANLLDIFGESGPKLMD